MTVPALLFGETDAERESRIMDEQRAADLRVVREALPIVRLLHLTDHFPSQCEAARRLVAKGYRVTLHITASDTWMEVRGMPS